jgi:hypothetical protein
MKHDGECQSDCVTVQPLEGTPLVIYPALDAGDYVSRSSLIALQYVGGAPFPLTRQRVEFGTSIGVKTCRITSYPRGQKHGLRPGMQVPIALTGALQTQLTLLTVEDDNSIGVYDVQNLNMGKP